MDEDEDEEEEATSGDVDADADTVAASVAGVDGVATEVSILNDSDCCIRLD